MDGHAPPITAQISSPYTQHSYKAAEEQTLSVATHSTPTAVASTVGHDQHLHQQSQMHQHQQPHQQQYQQRLLHQPHYQQQQQQQQQQHSPTDQDPEARTGSPSVAALLLSRQFGSAGSLKSFSPSSSGRTSPAVFSSGNSPTVMVRDHNSPVTIGGSPPTTLRHGGSPQILAPSGHAAGVTPDAMTAILAGPSHEESYGGQGRDSPGLDGGGVAAIAARAAMAAAAAAVTSDARLAAAESSVSELDGLTREQGKALASVEEERKILVEKVRASVAP